MISVLKCIEVGVGHDGFGLKHTIKSQLYPVDHVLYIANSNCHSGMIPSGHRSSDIGDLAFVVMIDLVFKGKKKYIYIYIHIIYVYINIYCINIYCIKICISTDVISMYIYDMTLSLADTWGIKHIYIYKDDCQGSRHPWKA